MLLSISDAKLWKSNIFWFVIGSYIFSSVHVVIFVVLIVSNWSFEFIKNGNLHVLKVLTATSLTRLHSILLTNPANWLPSMSFPSTFCTVHHLFLKKTSNDVETGTGTNGGFL